MHWTQYDGVYPPGYIVPHGVQPSFHARQPATWGWARQHGPAIIHYLRERPVGADGVLLSDGTRGRAETTLYADGVWRRPLNDPDKAWREESARVPVKWQWGTLETTDNEALFVESAPPSPELDDGGASTFKRELYDSADLRAVVSDFDAARVLFAYGTNYEFTRASDGLQQRFSGNGDAAEFVAAVRRFGEYWADFKWSDLGGIADLPAVERRVEDVLVGLGWRGSFERQARLDELDAVKAHLRSRYPDLDKADSFFASGHHPDTGKAYTVFFSSSERKPKR